MACEVGRALTMYNYLYGDSLPFSSAENVVKPGCGVGRHGRRDVESSDSAVC